jgi:hypothetical protein
MRWGDDEDTDPPPRRHLSNPYARVSPHAREIIMGIMEMKPCWVRIAGVHVKGRYLLASQEKCMKPMAVPLIDCGDASGKPVGVAKVNRTVSGEGLDGDDEERLCKRLCPVSRRSRPLFT